MSILSIDKGGNNKLKLTTKSEFSILSLIFIARHQKDGLVKVESICKQYKISKKYLEQILFLLKRNGYIKAKTGANGGYCLNRPSDQISLAEIIRLMDGALAPTSAVSRYFYQETPIVKEKKVMKVFKEIRDYIANKVENLTISDMV